VRRRAEEEEVRQRAEEEEVRRRAEEERRKADEDITMGDAEGEGRGPAEGQVMEEVPEQGTEEAPEDALTEDWGTKIKKMQAEIAAKAAAMSSKAGSSKDGAAAGARTCYLCMVWGLVCVTPPG
jgi:hypothetical protein